MDIPDRVYLRRAHSGTMVELCIGHGRETEIIPLTSGMVADLARDAIAYHFANDDRWRAMWAAEFERKELL